MLYSCSAVTKPIKNTGGIRKALKHNERGYEENEIYDKTKIIELKSSTPENFYNSWLKSNIDEYNSKQKRKDRQFKDGFDFINRQSERNIKRENEFKSNNQDLDPTSKEYKAKFEKEVINKSPAVASEVIFMVGDKNKNPFENEKQIKDFYTRMLSEFQEKYNDNIKIMSAHIHNDESTPHLHVIFAPYKRVNKSIGVSIGQRNFMSGTAQSRAFQDWSHETMQDILTDMGLEAIIAEKNLDPEKKRKTLTKGQLKTEEQFNKYFESKGEQLQDLVQEINNLEETRDNLKQELKKYQEDYERTYWDYTNLRKNGENLKKQNLQLTEENNTIKNENEELKYQQQSIIHDIQKLKTDRQDYFDERDDLIDKKHLLIKEIKELEEKERILQRGDSKDFER